MLFKQKHLKKQKQKQKQKKKEQENIFFLYKNSNKLFGKYIFTTLQENFLYENAK